MQNLSLFELISLAVSLLSAIVLFAYKYPNTYKSFKPVKTLFIYGVIALMGSLVWNFAVDKTYSKLQNLIKADSLKEASAINSALLVSKSDFLFGAIFFVFILFLAWTLSDIHDFLKHDKDK